MASVPTRIAVCAKTDQGYSSQVTLLTLALQFLCPLSFLQDDLKKNQQTIVSESFDISSALDHFYFIFIISKIEQGRK